MVDDPYKILGLSPEASQDEIKKAYRRMAKKYHPDLHPNDPNANKRMNEINEAYDMLTNPEKYAARQAQQQSQSQQRSGYHQQYGQGGQRYGQRNQQGYNPYQGPGGWSSEFDPDFEDIFGSMFGFGFAGQQQASVRPQRESGDSPEICRAVDSINSGNAQEAIRILTYIPSTGRNARWYYLSSLANHSLGNIVQAVDQMQRAVQMEPQNQVYNQLLRQFRRAGQTYEQNARGFDMQAVNMQRFCASLCMVQMCCGVPCRFRCI